MLSQQLSLLLTQQRLLDEKTLEKNLDIGSKAWYDGSIQVPFTISEAVLCLLQLFQSPVSLTWRWERGQNSAW